MNKMELSVKTKPKKKLKINSGAQIHNRGMKN